MSSLSDKLSKGPTEHLSWKELACKDGTPYPVEFIQDGRVFILANLFEEIRFLCGNSPIRIASAYRTIKYNKRIGGAQFSQHLQGRALDLFPPKGMPLGVFYNIIYKDSFKLGVHGLGRYLTFVHVDIRPINKLITW